METLGAVLQGLLRGNRDGDGISQVPQWSGLRDPEVPNSPWLWLYSFYNAAQVHVVSFSFTPTTLLSSRSSSTPINSLPVVVSSPGTKPGTYLILEYSQAYRYSFSEDYQVLRVKMVFEPPAWVPKLPFGK